MLGLGSSGSHAVQNGRYTVQLGITNHIVIVIVICQVLLEYHGHDTSVKPYVRGTLGDNEALRVIITYHQVHVY